MLKFYLDFIDDNREVLLHGKLAPLYPEAFYSAVYAQKGSSVIVALYSASSFTATDGLSSLTVVNAAGSEKVYIDLENSFLSEYTIKNCMGEITEQGNVASAVAVYHVSHNGMIEFAE